MPYKTHPDARPWTLRSLGAGPSIQVWGPDPNQSPGFGSGPVELFERSVWAGPDRARVELTRNGQRRQELNRILRTLGDGDEMS